MTSLKLKTMQIQVGIVGLSAFTDNSSLNLLYARDAEGKVRWGKIHDLKAEKTLRLVEFPSDYLSVPHPLMPFDTGQTPQQLIRRSTGR